MVKKNTTPPEETAEARAFVREIEEDMNREQFLAQLKRYGLFFAPLLIVLLVGYGGWQWWLAQSLKKQQGWNAAYVAALELADSGKGKEASTALEKLIKQTDHKSYGALAAFSSASLAGREGAANVAAKQYADIANDPQMDPLLQELAVLAAASRTLDTPLAKDLQQRLETLASGNSPLHYSAKELLAVQASKNNQITEAIKHWQAIESDIAAPEGLQQRAHQALMALEGKK